MTRLKDIFQLFRELSGKTEFEEYLKMLLIYLGSNIRDVKPGAFPKSFSKTIQKLFNERQSGDYDFGGSIGADIAEEDIEQVKKIIESCETYLSGFYQVPREYWKE